MKNSFIKPIFLLFRIVFSLPSAGVAIQRYRHDHFNVVVVAAAAPVL